MWSTKKFETSEEMKNWLAKHDGKIQFQEVFIENGYAVEWRWLRQA